MKPFNSITPFDNLMLAYVTKEGQTTSLLTNLDKEAEIVLKKHYETMLPKEKVEGLLSTLTQALAKNTLGIIVSEALSGAGVTAAEIQVKTGLTTSSLEAIKSDAVFPNSIPVKSLVKLLKLIGVTVEKAKEAINTTFDKLSVEGKMLLSIPTQAQPSFRKGIALMGSSSDLKRLKSDESYLYQNKEALEKYTRRLEELFLQM